MSIIDKAMAKKGIVAADPEGLLQHGDAVNPAPAGEAAEGAVASALP